MYDTKDATDDECVTKYETHIKKLPATRRSSQHLTFFSLTEMKAGSNFFFSSFCCFSSAQVWFGCVRVKHELVESFFGERLKRDFLKTTTVIAYLAFQRRNEQACFIPLTSLLSLPSFSLYLRWKMGPWSMKSIWGWLVHIFSRSTYRPATGECIIKHFSGFVAFLCGFFFGFAIFSLFCCCCTFCIRFILSLSFHFRHRKACPPLKLHDWPSLSLHFSNVRSLRFTDFLPVYFLLPLLFSFSECLWCAPCPRDQTFRE